MSEKFHFLQKICLIFSQNVSVKYRYFSWRCVWNVFKICLQNGDISPENVSKNVNISPQNLSELFKKNCLWIVFLKVCLTFQQNVSEKSNFLLKSVWIVFKICLRNIDISPEITDKGDLTSGQSGQICFYKTKWSTS